MIDAKAELAAIQQRRKIARRKIYRRSALDEFRAELVALRMVGATLKDLQIWLRGKRRRISISTICRYLQALPELRRHDA